MEKNKENSFRIKKIASEIGFSACGISPATFLEKDHDFLENWLKNGFQSGMSYMNNHFDKRLDARKLVENSKSVISVLLNYFTDDIQKDPNAPKVAKYAFYNDYHDVLKSMLNCFFERINNEITDIKGRSFVDSAPILEKAYARNSGLGWIGKNSCLINKNLGSFVFIGELIVDIELDYDKPVKNHCGNCKKCLQACPTGAIIEPGVIDARKCISYLSIENKGDIPAEFSDKFSDMVFGCDICQDVCPWNKNAADTDHGFLKINNDMLNLSAEEWHAMDEIKFNKILKGSPIKRIKFEGLKRNLNFLKKSKYS
ncbi:MAG: tRNA epoxyqueuosine(34) reductase QueG [Bacteroidota bacterium]